MKNFTNNFKQFTSRLSARWLIMALMLLVGTSSAWAQDMYVAGSMTNWATNQVKLSTSSSTYSGYYYATFTVEAGTYEYKIKESGNNWWCSTYNTTNSNGVTYSSRSNNCDNIKITVASKGTLEIYHNKTNDNTFAIFYVPCTKSISEESGTYENGAITLSAKFNTCGSAYIGFQWKEKGNVWCYEDKNTNPCFIPLGEQSKENEIATKTVSKSGGTYVFRPYIVDGSDATKWIYGDEFEVITCSDPSAGYSISNENASVDWDGTEKEVIITTVNGYATPSKIYYEGSETKPTAVGEYTITIDVPSKGTYCAATGLEIGTFTITCPAVAVPTVVANPSEIIKCGIDFKQRAEITITKLDGLTYTCTLGGNAVTIPNNGPITNIEEAGEYTITATNGCGNSNSTPVTITLTDNTVDISEIFGEPTICAGTKEQVYSIDKITSDGISYSWTLTGEGLNKISSTDNTVSISADNAATQTEGVLYATVTKNGCETTSNPKTITLIPLPTITTVDPTSGEACSNTTIADLEKDLTITKSANTNTKWYFNAAEQDVTAMLQAGDYTIKAITETGGCISSQGIVYTVTNIAESPDAPFANNTSKDICESYTEFNLTELVGWDAEDPENENITISWYTKDGENYISTDAEQKTIAANTFYARTQNETGCYSDYVALVIPTPIKPEKLNLTTTPANGITTPWVAIEVTVDGSKGAYTVSYPNNLNTVKNIQITKEGDTYTYLIPRPSAWGTGDDPNQNSGKKQVDYTVRATLNGGSESCPSMGEVIIRLQDEANDTCNH